MEFSAEKLQNAILINLHPGLQNWPRRTRKGAAYPGCGGEL